MQVILLNYPSVTGEVLLSSYTGYVACTSIEMKTSSGGSIGTSAFGDSAESSTSLLSMSGEQLDSRTTLPSGGSGTQAPQRLGIDSLTVHRVADRATPKFLSLAFAAREDGDVATITVLRANESGDSLSDSSGQSWNQPFLTLTLTDVHISSHSLTIGADALEETIDISFKELDVSYTVYTNGQINGSVTCHVDLVAESTS